jgi:Fur family zinc uptake transcriptional regulator
MPDHDSAPDRASAAFPAGTHDHAHCVATALDNAERLCTLRGARFTPLRRRVLELIWGSHAPVGAYDLLRQLSQEHDGAAPPTVYRALEFLQAHGLVHRIEGLNAYIGCGDPQHCPIGQFLICTRCGDAAELTDSAVEKAIAREAAGQGFAVEHKTVEIYGRCPSCQRRDDAEGPDAYGRGG